MRSTRARRCASGSSRVFAFVVRRLIGIVFVLFAITVPDLPDLLRNARDRPEQPARGAQPRPGDGRSCQAPVRARPAAAGPLRADDEAALHLARPRLVRQPGAQGRPGDPDAAPVTFSLVFGAAVLWVIGAIAIGLADGDVQGDVRRPITHDPGADRHLDAGLLAGRGGEPDHAGPAARHDLLQLGAAARLHALHAGPVAMVPAPDLPVDHALDPLHRLLRSRAPGRPAPGAERGLRPHGQGEGPLAARASSSGTCCAPR